eukprot:365693-Chlamydomonas_euryale.AAC.30
MRCQGQACASGTQPCRSPCNPTPTAASHAVPRAGMCQLHAGVQFPTPKPAAPLPAVQGQASASGTQR